MADDLEEIAHDLDLHDPRVAALSWEIYSVYEQMRRESGGLAHGTRYGGYWWSIGYEETQSIARDWKHFSSAVQLTIPARESQPLVPPLGSDPPEQQAYRKVLNPFFGPKAIEAMEPELRRRATELIDDFIEKGSCDLAQDFAIPLPGQFFFTEMLHIPAEDLEQCRTWLEMFNFEPEADPERAMQGQAQLFGYVLGFVQSRRASEPMGDVVDGLLREQVGESYLDDTQVATVIMVLIAGGLETTTHGIVNAAYLLASAPGIRDQLLADPSLVPSAVEEFLRVNAVMAVATGVNDLVLAGGVESMSNAVFYSVDMRWGGARTGIRMHDGLVRARETAGGRFHPVLGGMIETAENLRKEYSITREEQDQLALQSHQRALSAQRNGILAEEIVPVTVRTRKGEQVVVTDEHPRADASLESLAKLTPIMMKQDPEATVTAGNASGQNDAASLCVVTTRDKAEALGLKPLVKLVSWRAAGVPPKVMGIGPVPAAAGALGLGGLKLSAIDVIELNEAFAAQALAVMKTWAFSAADHERTNVHGSGISLGHPVGATGGRMLATLAREMHRRDARYGLETMCIGGGQGLAAVFETVR